MKAILPSRNVFIAGGTGYMGKQLISALTTRGHTVRALVRPGSKATLSTSSVIVGDPLRRETFSDHVSPSDTWVHLVGVSHPSPSKAEHFKAVDLKSVEVAVPVALTAKIRHFVYVSVAHPAPMMKAYIEVRTRCEELLFDSGLNVTILRPWYVLGPGHRWPYLLVPIYKLFEKIPSTSASARRLGLVTLTQTISALVYAVENPAEGRMVMDVPRIRALQSS